MTRSVSFDVVGLPHPQGSKSAFVRGGRAVIVEGSSKSGRDKHAAWRAAVADGARKALANAEPFLGPTECVMVFYLPLPASDPHRTLHVSAPDLDKLVRSTGDALVNAGLLKDDSLLWLISAKKGYARNGQWTGVHISLADSSDAEASMRETSKAEAKAARKSAKRS
jgi:Holliday junction resolvase RusA-like endonuclease